jgi:hypothetical protein
MKLIAHFHPVPRLGMHEAIPPLPVSLQDMVLNKFSTETLTLSQHFSGGTEDNHGRFLFKQLIPHSASKQETS